MKYLSSKTFGCKDIGIGKISELVSKTRFFDKRDYAYKIPLVFQGYGVLFFIFVALFFPEENFTFMMFPSSTFLYSSTDTASHRL